VFVRRSGSLRGKASRGTRTDHHNSFRQSGLAPEPFPGAANPAVATTAAQAPSSRAVEHCFSRFALRHLTLAWDCSSITICGRARCGVFQLPNQLPSCLPSHMDIYDNPTFRMGLPAIRRCRRPSGNPVMTIASASKRPSVRWSWRCRFTQMTALQGFHRLSRATFSHAGPDQRRVAFSS